jgi:DNA mismatch endonuclease (patch repair protein)
MSRIRGKNTKPELALRKSLSQARIRFRLQSNLPGKPDIVIAKEKIAVFVDGCFWHACPLHLQWPRNNAKFWREKILSNRSRDRARDKSLKALGWKVIRLWEHQVVAATDKCAHRIVKAVLARRKRGS